MLESTTLEEANIRVGNWIRQRSRWMKGYMMTYLVHMRRPLALLWDLGFWRFAGVQLFVAGIVPGVLGGLLLMGMAYRFAVRYNYPVEEVFNLKHLWSTFKDAALAFLLPFTFG